ETPGIASREEHMRSLVCEELKPLVTSISTDAMGNVIGVRKGKGSGPKVMLAAHMDEIGFMVRFVDDKGFIRIQPVGGFDARVPVAQRVWVHGCKGNTLRGTLMPAAKPIHMLTPEEAGKPAKLEDLYVDVGLPGPKVKEMVELGDMITMDRTLEHVGETVVS